MKSFNVFVSGLLLLMATQINAKELTFGVVPQQSASVLAAAWEPLLAEVSRETGIDLKFETAPSIPEFEQRCAAGEYDLAYMNPYHYTVFSGQPGYRAIAHQANKKIQGIMVVRKDSPVTRLEQLADQPMAFPAPAAFAASMLTRGYLDKVGIPIKPNYVYSHDAVYKAVANGSFVAGGGIQRTFKKMDPEIRNQLRVLWTTQTYTPHAFAVHPDIKTDDAQAIQAAFSKLNTTPAGQALLAPLGFSSIQAADDEQWDDVRSLNLHMLDLQANK